MKAIRFTLLLSTVLLYNVLNAQRPQNDSVFWENGDVTFLSDLDNVWIILKKGSDLKNVRIREIKKLKGILVYEKEKCLHDVYIGNIKRIQPGKHALSYMYFYADNTPYIKKEFVQMDALITYSDFKSVKSFKTHSEVKSVNEKTEDIPEAYTTITGSLYPNTDINISCDTIIEGNGVIILAKLIEINSRLIRYKKIKNPDGPIYIKSNKDAQITKYNNCYSVNFTKQ